MFRDTFYGQKISDYGRQNGRVDYRALASAFDLVLCNGLLGYRDSFEDWEQIGGYIDNTEELEELTAKRDELTDKLSELTDELIDLNEDIENTGEAVSRCEDASEVIEDIGYYIRQLNNYEDDDESDADYAIDYLKGYLEDYLSDVKEIAEEKQSEVDKLNEEIDSLTEQIEELEAEEDEQQDVYQWYIISDSGAQILQENAPHEVLYYNEALDLYLWGVTHWGTSWDYVLTSIPCETYEEQRAREEAEAKAEQEAKARVEAMTEEERAKQETEELEDLLDLWEQEHREDIDNAVVEAVTEEIPVYFTDDEEPNELTPTLRDASGQPYTVGYTVRAVENCFGIPVGFVGKVTDIFAESDGLLWAEVTNDNGSTYRGLADDWQSLGDSANEGGDK